MCLALVAWRAHPRFALVLAANRDEYHARGAVAATWWDDGWLAGRDLAGGGTWLGITRAGRWALLTNVREPARHDPKAPSRGALVVRILAAADDAGVALASAIRDANGYNGFNLLAGDRGTTWWGSNRVGAPHTLAPGLHGLSNATLDTPWPKVTRSKAALAAWCATSGTDIESVFALLGDRTIAPDNALPATGIPRARERQLSSPFIVGDDYGTRCSTVVAITHAGEARFVERSFDASARLVGECDYRFMLADTASP